MVAPLCSSSLLAAPAYQHGGSGNEEGARQQGLEVGRMKDLCGDCDSGARWLVIVVGRSKVPTWVECWRANIIF